MTPEELRPLIAIVAEQVSLAEADLAQAHAAAARVRQELAQLGKTQAANADLATARMAERHALWRQKERGRLSAELAVRIAEAEGRATALARVAAKKEALSELLEEAEEKAARQRHRRQDAETQLQEMLRPLAGRYR